MLRYLRGTGHHMKTIWWVLIIVTVVTFLGGFVFLLGSGLSGGFSSRVGSVATVEGEPISQRDFQNALQSQRAMFVSRFGEDPGERDEKSLEVQAYRSLVLQRLLSHQARELGLKAHDRDVIVSLQTSPPAELQAAPAFQTNGQFDPSKYQQAMRNPDINWAPFEDVVREQVPVRKLQERLFTSVKLTELDLRQFWRDRNERVTATLATILPETSGPAPQVSDADLQKVYDKYKGRLASDRQVQVEALVIPKAYDEKAVGDARERTNRLIQRARAGESFLALSRENSDAPGADKGGVIDRVFSPSEFGADLGPKIALMDTGQVTEAIQDGGRFMFFKVLQKLPNPQTGQPGVKVAQIMIRVNADENALRKQYEDLDKIRVKAQHDGLGKAATASGLTTTKSGFFDLRSTPQELNAVPEAADWAYGAKLREVSHVMEGVDHFAIIQVTAVKPDGVPPRDQVTTQLQQIAQLEKTVDRAQAKADAMAKALKGGATLEQAAASVGATVERVENVTRLQQDPKLMGSPETIGMLFAAQPGQVIGPVRGLNGFYAARLESKTEPDWNQFDQARAQIAQQILDQRQRTFMESFMVTLRSRAKVKDLRGVTAYAGATP